MLDGWLRRAGHKVDPMVLVLYFAFICVPGGVIGLLLDPAPLNQPTTAQWYGKPTVVHTLFLDAIRSIKCASGPCLVSFRR